MAVSISTVEALVSDLVTKKWVNLHKHYRRLEGCKNPGVYLLAYSDKNLEGQQVKLEDIFYVGMSHAGVIARLYQFIRGIENGKHHSGAMRFFKTYASEVPFSKLPTKKTFFVAATAIECVTDKKLRTAEDLRKMGEVARLEFYVLAHIKEMCNKEPELNKK